MKTWIAVLASCLACAVALAVWFATDEHGDTASVSASTDFAARIDLFETELADVRRELAALRLRADEVRATDVLETPRADDGTLDVAPSEPVRGSTRVSASGPAIDARFYLDQYVRSFESSGNGSEFYRLAVAAHAAALRDELCDLVRAEGTNSVLRARLIEMLGDRPFQHDATVIQTLVDVLRAPLGPSLHASALQSLQAIGNAQTALALEQVVWSMQSGTRKLALRAIVALTGEDLHRVLARLLARAPDDAASVAVLAALDPSRQGGVDVFDVASTRSQPVRLLAAGRIGAFSDPAVRAFIGHWLSFETDEQVRAALQAAQKQDPPNARRAWTALQAVGPPNANPAHDDQNAWAPRSAEMGVQWLELDYASPQRCHTVRIHEVCAAGAVIEVVAYDESGAAHRLWAGTDPTAVPGVFELRVAPTTFRVRKLRIVLDTDATRGWNEIDAVQIVGPDGGVWASDARASSSYGG